MTTSGHSVLQLAVSMNRPDLVKLLVEKYKLQVEDRSSSKQTCLMIACNFGFHGMVKYFIEKGSDLNAIDSTNFNALTHAIRNQHIACSIYLLHLGINRYQKDINGCTMLHWAAFKNDLFLFLVLSNLGLDGKEEDQHGLTAFGRAWSNSAYDIVEHVIRGEGSLRVP